jgi:hypothetical protein
MLRLDAFTLTGKWYAYPSDFQTCLSLINVSLEKEKGTHLQWYVTHIKQL